MTSDGLIQREIGWYGEELVHFYANDIEVDGVSCTRSRGGMDTVYSSPMFTMKEDSSDYEQRNVDDSGYMDSNVANWNSPYIVNDFHRGEIDEEIWLKFGLILGAMDEDCEYYRALIAEGQTF